MYNWFVRDALISRAPWGELGAGPSHRKRGLGKASSGVPGLLRSTPKQRARWHEGARESLGESLERGTGLSDRSAGPASREAGGGPRMAEQFRACLGEVAGVSLSLCLSRVAVRLDPAVRALAGSLRGQPGRGVDTLGPLLEVCTPVAPPSQLFSRYQLNTLDRAPPQRVSAGSWASSPDFSLGGIPLEPWFSTQFSLGPTLSQGT